MDASPDERHSSARRSSPSRVRSTRDSVYRFTGGTARIAPLIFVVGMPVDGDLPLGTVEETVCESCFFLLENCEFGQSTGCATPLPARRANVAVYFPLKGVLRRHGDGEKIFRVRPTADEGA